jgi:hypothetical protein
MSFILITHHHTYSSSSIFCFPFISYMYFFNFVPKGENTRPLKGTVKAIGHSLYTRGR